MPGPVVTRFAPSPTGFLHIGGARTALFNWLYSRRHDGRFLLRIEDTDRARSTQPAVDAILDGLSWLGLQWDDEPIFQFSRAARHREIAEQLLETGHAYRCYASPQDLDEMREKARAEGRPPRYDGRWRDRSPDEAPAGVEPALRFKAPQDGQTIIDDQVQGRVVFENVNLDDLIILRSDGTPTYNLSVVVDDHDMGVTHIIRGDDHLTNAARQSQIYEAMNWQRPTFAHVPLIHGPDGAKLSKRHGALGVDAYRAMGYLPEALRNYLVRLGWSHGDEEVFSTERLLEVFDTAAIGKSPARFDFKKLENLNAGYIRQTDDDTLIAHIRRMLPDLAGTEHAGLAQPQTDEHWRMLREALPGLKERARTLIELVDGAAYLFVRRPLAVDEKAAKLLDDDARALLGRLAAELSDDALAGAGWNADKLESLVKDFAERETVKLGKVAQPLRAALTGRTTSPGIFDVLAVLGREESLARLSDQASAG